MMNKAKQLKKLISEPKRIVITTHRGPDGDAMGSSLALFHFLKSLGHTVNVITPNAYAEFLHWLPGNKAVIVYDENENFANDITSSAELIFLLDFSDLNRISTFANSVKISDATKIMIDHHQDPDESIAELIFSDTKSCSTAQLVYEIIDSMNMLPQITLSIAECLYVGIMTDTGSFKYASTTSKTHNVVAALIDAGVDNSKIHDLIYDNSSASRIKLLGYCLNEKLRIYSSKSSAIISLNAEELSKFEFKKGDTEGFVNYALGIKGIKFAVFIAEKDGVVKLSLRSKGNIKVNEIANEYFQGGGHTNASGGISQVSVDETIKILEKIINNLNN